MKKLIFLCVLIVFFYLPSYTQNADSTENIQVFKIVEEPAEFSGGETARLNFLSQNLKYPDEARKNNIQGIVYVGFIVEPDGSLTDIKILRGIGGGCDEEVLRVVSIMPKWKPGKQSGKNVRVQFSMPVKFVMQGGKKKKKS